MLNTMLLVIFHSFNRTLIYLNWFATLSLSYASAAKSTVCFHQYYAFVGATKGMEDIVHVFQCTPVSLQFAGVPIHLAITNTL